MSRPLLVKGVLISSIALLVGLLLWGLLQKMETTDSFSVKEKPFLYPIKSERVSNTIYDGNRLIARIEVDAFKINPRKFFVFNIKPFNEATLTNAKLEIHHYADMPSEVGLFPLGEGYFSSIKKGKASVKGLGLVTRGIVKGLTLEVYKADQLSLVVKAEEAYINFRNKEMKLRNGSLEEVLSKKVIRSKSMIWDNKAKLFKIPGVYTAETPKGRASGKGIRVDLDFNVMPLS